MPYPLPYSTNILEHLDVDAPPATARVYGVELEMEPRAARRADQSGLVSALNGPSGEWYILKSDGSLQDGVEIVSLPLSLAEHQRADRWPALLKPVTARARSGAGTTRCGIHVHANRANMSALTLGKILVFINHPENQRLVETIAQRSQNSYCRRQDKKLADGQRTGADRYQAVNVTRHTVEFRIFRGSIRPERVMKNVEFVDAVIHYCEDSSIVAIGRDTFHNHRNATAGFVAYVTARKHLYPALYQFMIESNLISAA